MEYLERVIAKLNVLRLEQEPGGGGEGVGVSRAESLPTPTLTLVLTPKCHTKLSQIPSEIIKLY